MDSQQFLGWTMAAIGGLGLVIINGLKEEIKKLNTQVTELNVNVALVAERHDNLDKRVDRLERVYGED